MIKLMPYVFIGGGLGACLRFMISTALFSLGQKFWLGTLIANMIGSLFFFLMMKGNWPISYTMSAMLKVGLLGALTTFSTFSYEVVSLCKAGQVKEGIAVFLLNIVFGIMIGIGILR